MTNTSLIAYNRATTILLSGTDDKGHVNAFQCSNITIRDLTIEGQPHLAVANVTNAAWTDGDIVPSPGANTGKLIWNWAPSLAKFNYNILITNCQFLFGDFFVSGGYMSNVMVRNCDFTVWGGSNVFSGRNETWGSNTTNYDGSVGVFCSGFNLAVMDCVYNGNTNLSFWTAGSLGSTNLGPDGLVWFQGSSPGAGNNFVAWNAITNNHFEGIQVDSGPTAIVGNLDCSCYNNVGCTALCARGSTESTLVGAEPFGYSTCFIGNWVLGGKNGEEGSGPPLFRLDYSGNCLSLYQPTMAWSENPGGMLSAAAELAYGNIAANTLLSGGHGIYCSSLSQSVIVLNNDFRGATYKSIGWTYWATPSIINDAQVYGNLLGEGTCSHVQVQCSNTFGWFLNRNAYYNGTNVVTPFIDPLSSSIHLNP